MTCLKQDIKAVKFTSVIRAFPDVAFMSAFDRLPSDLQTSNCMLPCPASIYGSKLSQGGSSLFLLVPSLLPTTLPNSSLFSPTAPDNSGATHVNDFAAATMRPG